MKSEVTIPSVITKMMKLRYFHIPRLGEARYDDDSDSSWTNNLQSLSGILIHNLEDEEMLTWMHLQQFMRFRMELEHIISLS